jgi:DNA-binding LacI/PurR family transcriptional regulator
VRQRFDEIGARALRLLLERIEGGPARSATVAPELVVRESSAPPR